MASPKISFEFFPPKNLEGSFRLWDCVNVLAQLEPEFVSVTYGAGGATRKLTHDAVTAIDKTTGLKVAAHLTCVDATRSETLAIAEEYAAAGIKDIVALRGDAPRGSETFTAHADGFSSSVELIEALSATGKFTLRVGAYPEKHPEAASQDADVAWLKRKIDAGAAAAITSFSRRTLFPFPRQMREGRHRRPNHPRHPARRELEGRIEIRRRNGHQHPASYHASL